LPIISTAAPGVATVRRRCRLDLDRVLPNSLVPLDVLVQALLIEPLRNLALRRNGEGSSRLAKDLLEMSAHSPSGQ